MTELSAIEQLLPPAPEFQIPVLLAFQRIIRLERTAEGRVWYPGRLFEELWENWPERPHGPGHKIEYAPRWTQTLSRLRRGVTDYVRDPVLFALIEDFVRRQGKYPIRFPAAEVQLLHDTAQKVLEFWGPLPRGKPKWPRLIGQEKTVLARLETISSFGRISQVYLAMRVPSADLNELGQDNPNLARTSYWPATLFGLENLHRQIGFYVPSREVALFRSTLIHSAVLVSSGPKTERMRRTVNINISPGRVMDSRGSTMMRIQGMKELSICDQDFAAYVGEHRYTISTIRRGAEFDMAETLLNFLDKESN